MVLTIFAGGSAGKWEVERVTAVTGASLADVDRLDVTQAPRAGAGAAAWVLRGTTSHERYTHRSERAVLEQRQPLLGRPEATRAALVPVSKSARWWALAADERRELLADRSHHIAIGAEYLPRVARRLHHGRDLGEEFDFLTWFEYAPSDAAAFEELVARLRATPEWAYVEREVDVRLVRARLPT